MTIQKNFDALAFKRQAQDAILAETQGMSAEEFVRYVEQKIEAGPLAEWFREHRREVKPADPTA